MIRYDLIAAFRNILRNRIPSLISITGLGIGLGCIMVLLALIVHEKSFDRYIPQHQNVYRIIFGNSGQTHYPLAESMAAEFPGVKDYFRYYQGGPLQMKLPDNKSVSERGFAFADASMFSILGVKFISGSPAASMSEVAVSEEIAMKYFGNLSPLGSVIQVRFTDGFATLSVAGVYRNLPRNSTLNPMFVADIELSEKIFAQFQKTLGAYGNENSSSLNWSRPEFTSYVVLDPRTDPGALADMMEKYKELMTAQNIAEQHYRLQPVTDIYLGSDEVTGSYFLRRGNPRELLYYEIISLFILVISITNYILLARASVSGRIHQLGTRKVFGASLKMIRRLILLESNLIVILSLIPAFFIIDSGMDFINDTLNKNLGGQVFLNPVLWLLLIVVIAVTGNLTGWIIGFKYSRIPALPLITGNIPGKATGRWRNSFLLLHFIIFLILVSGVMSVSKQIKYSMSGYVGIDPTNVLVTQINSDELRGSFNAICEEMQRVPGVVRCAGGSFIPPLGNYLPITLAVQEGERVRFDGLIIGEGLTELLGIEVIDGTSFGPYRQGTPEILLNESSAKKYNVKAGEQFMVFNVRGIVRDFNAHSLHTLIEPMVILQQNPERMGILAIKTDGINDESVIARLRELFAEISPDEIFEVNYLTDDIAGFYGRERNQMRIIAAFSVLATILSITGLFGISLISISGRRNEIGIRKVNGASVREVMLMLNVDFIKWVVLAFVIAVPVSIWLLNKWLVRFAYKTELSWWIFGLAGLAAVLVAVLTVSWQSWKAATRNPVEALRYE